MATERLEVRLLMQAQQYKREARDAATATGKIAGQAKEAGTATSGLQTKMSGLGSVMRGAAVAGGVLAVGRGLMSAFEAAERAASALAVTEQVIAQTGGSANVTATDVLELSRRLSALTGVEDELIQEGANVLLTFRNIKNEVGEGNDVFDRTSELMLDIATVMNTDAAGAAVQLGKALNDPVAGMSALSRAGLTFNEEQKEQIRTLVESGDTLSAQKLILTELETQLGGTAAASADASDKISNAFGEISEAIGSVLLGPMEAVATELQHMIGLIDDLDRVAAHADGAAESAEAFLTVVQTETGGAGFLTGAGASIKEFVQFLIPGESRMENFREKLEELAERLDLPELVEARAGVEAMGEAMGLTASEIELVKSVLDGAIGSVEHVGRASGSSAGEVSTLSGSLGDLSSELDDQGGRWDDVITSMEDYEDMLRRLTDPVFKAIDDQRKLEDATKKYQDVIKDPDATVGEHEQAIWDLVQAQLAAEESAAELPEDLQAAADHVAILGDRAGITRDDLELLRLKIMEFDGLEANSTVRVNVVGGQRITGGNINTDVGLRQHGGPVAAGHPYVVGEAGPELFIPQQSGMVVSNSQMTTGSAVGGGQNINVFTLTWGDFVRKAADAGLEIQRMGW